LITLLGTKVDHLYYEVGKFNLSVRNLVIEMRFSCWQCGLGGNRTSVERETKCAVLRVDWTRIRVRLLINQVAKLFLENKGIFLISIFLSNLLILCVLFNHRGWLTSYFKCVNAMQFSDSSSEVELRLSLVGLDIQSSRDIFVDADGTSLVVQVQHSGSHITLIETNKMFEKIKPAETIWFVAQKIHGFD